MDNPHFRRGRTALENGSYTMAHAAFDRACADAPNDPVFEAYRAFAKYMTTKSGDATAGNDLWLAGVTKKNCRRIVEAATERAPGFDAGHVFLARMSIDEGSPAAALKHVEMALRLNAENGEAKRLSNELAARLPRGKPSVGKRISDWLSSVRAS